MPSLVVVVVLCCVGIGCSGYSEIPDSTIVSDSNVAGMVDPRKTDPVAEQRLIDDVRLGPEVDSDGRVPEELETDSFAADDSIYLSMDVSGAPAGSRVRVTVYREASDEAVWIDEDEVAPGPAFLNFVLEGSKLSGGFHRATVTMGDEIVAETVFEVVKPTS
jgi:hypothetical protein